MSALDPKLLKRLAPALEAVKERDAAAFRARKDAAEAVRRQISELEAAIREAGAGLDPQDLSAHAACQRYRAGAKARIAALTQTLREREAEEMAARAKLSRSHGAVEGCARLARQAPPPKRGV